MSQPHRVLQPTRLDRTEDGEVLPLLWWTPPDPVRVASSSVLGGGLGHRRWLLNAQVHPDYGRTDLVDHLQELARLTGLHGDGVGMLTAADVTAAQHRDDGGVEVMATVGLGWPTWAAADPDPVGSDGHAGGYRPGTINLWVVVPVALGDGALVNAVATATEAKVQALFDAGIAATGTASDAIAVACSSSGRPEPFGGPRSQWGARVARAVHGAVLAGALDDRRRALDAGFSRPPAASGPSSRSDRRQTWQAGQ